MTEGAIRITGGCQCGAVRYVLRAAPTDPHICHCRMCQKAFGSFFAPLAGVPLAAFELTRGTPAVFRSSDPTERGFCRDCGTPLTFRHLDRGEINVALGTLDAPEAIPPRMQYGLEGRLAWFATLPTLAGDGTTEQHMPELAQAIAASSHQHPDHDTEVWPPPSARVEP